jgi:two-component system sensor histidine kinase KdpD
MVLAATAHELRLPLSHIKGFVSSLRRTDVTWDPQTTSEFLEEIEVEADRLGELIDSMLADGARNASVSPSEAFELVSPAYVINSALHRVRDLVRDHRVQVDAPEQLPAFRMNRDGIERVIANLVQNAVKYSLSDSPIGVSAHVTSGGDLEFAVEDHGPGVPLEERERIFQPFFRSRTRIAGHGLGLAIALSIVKAHGGEIRVTDRPGGGARFNVLVPRAAVR